MTTQDKKIEALSRLVRFLVNHYLRWDTTDTRTWVTEKVREYEAQVGVRFIPADATKEEMKEAMKGFGNPLFMLGDTP